MAECYQCTDKGFLAEKVDDCGGFLPAGAVYDVPEIVIGHIPKWNGVTWDQVENHKGKEGFVDGKPFTIRDYGPLPEGWSVTPPEPTEAELCAQRIAEIKGELQSLDTSKVRPISGIIDGTATEDERTRLAELNAQTDDLRAELQMLEAFI